jgi:hypothetical protein
VDLNELYSEHQRHLMEADVATADEERQAHEITASHVAGRIGCMQRSLGAGGAAGWEALATPAEASLAAPDRHLEGHAT